VNGKPDSIFLQVTGNSWRGFMRIFQDIADSIGRTPLIKLNKIAGCFCANILVKIEGRNPAYSVKCRIGASMIWDAEEKGLIRPGTKIIEPTSGNTGIALAYVCAARGYPLTLTMPDTMSIERRRMLATFGARLELTPGAQGMRGAIQRAEELAASNPKHTFILQQFKNPANPAIHEKTTGPEIWEDTDGDVDVLVSGVGTGGTITGISRYFKKIRNKPIVSVAVEPTASPVISQTLAGQEIKPSSHAIQGIGAGFIPDTLDLEMVDRVETVGDEEAFDYAQRMAYEEGITCGISSGAAVAVALRLAQESGFRDKTILVILPDSGERYLSTGLFKGTE
jgi:cysteine synthase